LPSGDAANVAAGDSRAAHWIYPKARPHPATAAMLGRIFYEALELTSRAAIRQIGLSDAAAAGGC